MILKRCTKCKKKKKLSDFYVAKGRPRPSCKVCWTKAVRAWAKANPEKYKAIYRRNNHISNLKIRFGLTVEQFDQLFAKCGGFCEVCGNPEIRKRRLSLDHSHETGQIRGFVCSRCNLVLGIAEDSPEFLLLAAAYLKKYSLLYLGDGGGI